MSKLTEIFETKRREVEASRVAMPLYELRAISIGMAPPKGFRRAIAADPQTPALIAEVKKASPSQGLIRADFDPASIAKIYEAAGAACLSVLTDATYFQGSPEHLRAARQAVRIPILRKDFVCDRYQLWEARVWGADCVLLIVAELAKEGSLLNDLHAEATVLGLDVLVEVHDESEAEIALEMGADLIGVNHRSLATFKTDLAIGDVLLPLIASHSVAVAESAIETYADVERVAANGARAVLIGTTFCAAPDIGAKVREVMHWGEP